MHVKHIQICYSDYRKFSLKQPSNVVDIHRSFFFFSYNVCELPLAELNYSKKKNATLESHKSVWCGVGKYKQINEFVKCCCLYQLILSSYNNPVKRILYENVESW